MFAAFIMGASFLCALFIHTSTSYAVGLWVSLFLTSIFSMLLSRHTLREINFSMKFVFFWAFFLIIHSVFIYPIFHIYVTKVIDGGNILYYEQAFDTFSRVFTLIVCPIYCIALYKTRLSFLELHFHVIYNLLAIFAAYICFLEITGHFNEYFLYAYNGVDIENLQRQLIFKSSYDGQSGTLINRNNSATLINIGLLLSIGMYIKNKKNSNIIYGCIFAFALYATHSKAGVLAFICGFSYLMFMHYRKLRPLFFIAPFLSVPFVFMMKDAFTSFYMRFPVWEKTLELIKDYPLTGVGSGAFDYYYKKIRIEYHSSGTYAHNDYLQLAAEMGIPALLIFLGMLSVIFFRMNKDNSPAIAALLAVYIHSFISFPLYIPAISMVCGLLWFAVISKENLFYREF